MKFELETHIGVIIVDPKIEINEGTRDYYKTEEFQPSITFIFGDSRVFHQMPKQPYVNGTWSDKTVEDAVEAYLKDIAIKDSLLKNLNPLNWFK